MQDENQQSQLNLSPDVAFMQNMAILCAIFETGGEALMQVTGTEELSNQIGGVSQEQSDLQDVLAARLQHHLNI